jgi:hypothetical protein
MNDDLSINHLTQYAEDANEAASVAEKSAKNAVEAAIEAGTALNAARKLVRSSDWLEWLEENFRYSPRTAQKYMRIATQAGSIGAESLAKVLTAIAESEPAASNTPPLAKKMHSFSFDTQPEGDAVIVVVNDDQREQSEIDREIPGLPEYSDKAMNEVNPLTGKRPDVVKLTLAAQNHSRKCVSALECAMREADAYNQMIDGGENYARFDKGIRILWEIARGWT